MPFRYTLRTPDADDVGSGTHVDERWLRVGDVFEVGGKRWQVVDRQLAPETAWVRRRVLVVELAQNATPDRPM